MDHTGKKTPFSSSDLLQGEKLLLRKKVTLVEFSAGTYLFQVAQERKELFFPFIRIDDAGTLLDAFCDCNISTHHNACPHLAASYLKIFGDLPAPLHVRFQRSLWNALCKMASLRHGFDVDVLKKKEHEEYVALSVAEKPLFQMRLHTEKAKKILKEILSQKKSSLDESSLKIASLPEEELLLWRAGRPSEMVRYELSFWSDLAKWWMSLQEEKEEYTISFRYPKEDQKNSPQNSLPNWIHVHFSLISFRFYLAEMNWAELIPTLSTVVSPLTVSSIPALGMENLYYDVNGKKLHILSLESRGVLPIQEEEFLSVGDWGYISKKGFFPLKEDPLLKKSILQGEEIGSFLDRYLSVAQEFLPDAFHLTPTELNYRLHWNRQGDLEAHSFLFDPDEAMDPRNALLGGWVYLDRKGFFKIKERKFPSLLYTIDSKEMASFITENRMWLQQLEGFSIHLSSLEISLSYEVQDRGDLRFLSELLQQNLPEQVRFFDSWIYVEGKGFYSTSSYQKLEGIYPGLKIPKDRVNSFIQERRADLKWVEGFFAAKPAILKAGLHIHLEGNESSSIRVVPEYVFRAPLTASDILFYDDFVYVKAEGFSEIAPHCRLPPAYLEPKSIDKRLESAFVSYELDVLKDKILSLDPRLQKPKQVAWRLCSLKKSKSRKHLWNVELELETEFGSLKACDLWEGLQEGKNYLFTEAGLLFPRSFTLASAAQWLGAFQKGQWILKENRLKCTTLELLYLTALQNLLPPEGSFSEAEATRRYLHDLSCLKTDKILNLEGLVAQLRPYQTKGVEWLWFLYCYGLSGILSDEMGLGKTLQAASLILAIHNHVLPEERRFLVVCPTSVLFHWQAILQKFFPQLPQIYYHGPERDLSVFQKEGGVLLTTYGTVRVDIKEIKELFFEVAVLDEVHAGKNIQSQVHKALKQISARMKLGLTGTPIENRILELKALFDIILPGFLPFEHFFEEFQHPSTEKEMQLKKKEELSRYIRPFILRRKKQEVLLELPEKTEELAICELSQVQYELYRKTIEEKKEWISSLVSPSSVTAEKSAQKKGALKGGVLHVFALIARLKQICNHPALVLQEEELQEEEPHYASYSSGKWELFKQLLHEALESGQKVVVFSQYLKMLDLIALYLKDEKISYAQVRGSTKDRKEQVEKFQNDPRCSVFLASLQAAGVGIDLTAGSVVIHYDRWWNPARENQATDRVHRMGQNRGVQVFKMMTKGTIEEGIELLIQKKQKLLTDVVSYDDQDAIKIFSPKEVQMLLRMCPPPGSL